MNQTEARILAEIVLVATAYVDVNYDDVGFTWVHLPRFPLPSTWGKRTTELLVVLPSTYPMTAPDGFFMDKHLRTRHGHTINHYFQGETLNPYSDKGWAWFCMHIAGGWNPTSSLKHGDNLLKYVELIRAILTSPPRGQDW